MMRRDGRGVMEYRYEREALLKRRWRRGKQGEEGEDFKRRWRNGRSGRSGENRRE